jgi:hypothetical protein
MGTFSKYPFYNFVSKLIFLCKKKEFGILSKCQLDYKLRDGGALKK